MCRIIYWKDDLRLMEELGRTGRTSRTTEFVLETFEDMRESGDFYYRIYC